MPLLAENYSLEELREHIKTSLGGSIWRLEGMEDDHNNTVDQAISSALLGYSRRVPIYAWEVVAPTASNEYDIKQPGYGVWRVDFIEQSVIPGVVAGLNHSLTGVNALGIGATGSGDITQFLTWQKSYRRATTNDPRWEWDDDGQKLYIWSHHFQKACVYSFLPRDFDKVRLIHKDFVRRYALAFAKKQLAINRRKFQGTITGPGGQPIQLDSDNLVQEADAELEKLEEELRKFQPRGVPVWD